MTQAELNILIRVTAANARRQLAAIRSELAALQAMSRGNALGGLNAGAAGASGNLRQLNAEANNVTRGLTTMSGAASRAGAGVGGIASPRSMSSLRSMGSQMQWTGRQIAMNVTAPLALAGGMAIKWGFDNEAAGMRLKKVYGEVGMAQGQIDSELQALDKTFTALSNKFGMNKEAVIEVAGAWAAAGSSGLALAEQTELTARTMVLGNMSAEESTASLIAIQAQYGQSTKQLGYTISELNAIENVAATDLKGLVVGFSRAAGVARDAGIPTRELGAMIAALTPAAGSASEAGNGLKTMISRIMNPTSAATQVIREMGIATDETSWSSLTAVERMQTLSKKYQDLDDAQKAVVASTLASNWQVNRFSVAMRELNDETDGYYKKSMEATKDASKVFAVAQKELDTYMSANPTQAKQALQVIKNSMTDAFAPLIPFIVWILKQIANVMRAFTNLDPHIQKIVIASLALIAVLGPMIIFLGVLALSVSQLGFLWAGLGKVVSGVLFGPFKMIGKIFTSIGGSAMKMAAAVGSGFMKALRFTKLFRLTLLLLNGTWYAVQFAAGVAMAGLALIMRAGFLGIAALHRNWAAISLAIQGAWGTAMLALDAIRTKARLVMEAVFGAAHIAISRAWQATSRALQVAHNFIMLTISAGYWATFNTLQQAMWRLQAVIQSAAHSASLVLQRAWALASLGVVMAWGAAQAVLVRGYGMLMVGLEAAKNAAILVASRAFGIAYVAVQTVIMLSTVARWKAMFVMMIALARGGMMALVRGVAAAAMGLIGAISLPVTLTIVAVVALFLLFKDQIVQAIQNIIRYFQNLPEGIKNAFAPIGNIMGAVKNAIMGAFNSLPNSIQNAMRKVVALIQAAARKIYELFSYINPFAHHSPSLVENVTEGMGVVGDQFGSAANEIDGHIKGMYSSMQAFGSAAAGLLAEDRNAKAGDERAKIAKVAPDVLSSYDALHSSMTVLRADLEGVKQAQTAQEGVVKRLDDAVKAADETIDSMNDTLSMMKENADYWSEALDKAKTKLDGFANAPIKGMRQMEDQIFANEMAQKKLQLALMDMDASGVESATDSLARMQGAIEDAQGTKTELRLAGAGSDITGFYDQQIEALKAQQDATQQNLGPIEAMNKELDRLKLSAERMDLEKSLKFDPLTRQIQQMTDTTKELSFEEITSGIRSSQAEVTAYTAAFDMANLAVKGQEAAIEAATAARDGLKDAYDTENEKLGALNERYSEIENTIRDGESALSDLTSAADSSIQRMEDARSTMLDAIRMGMDPGSSKEAVEAAKQAKELEDAYKSAEEAQKKAKEGGAGSESVSPNLQNFRDAEGGNWEEVGGNFSIGREGGLGDQTGDIENFTAGLNNDLAGMLGGFDMFGPIKEKFNQFKGWWGKNVGSLGGPLVDAFGAIGGNIQTAFSGEGMDKISMLGQWIENIKNAVKTAGQYIVGFGNAIGRLFGPDLQATVKELVAGFTGLWTKVKPQLEELWNTLGPAIQTIAKALGPIIALVAGQIVGVIQIAWEMANGLIGPIFNFIGTVIESIIGAINGVIQVVKGAIDVIFAIGTIIKGIFTLDWETIKSGFSDLTRGIGDILGGLWDIVWAILDSVVSLFKNMGQAVWNVVYGFVKGVIDFFMWLWDELVGHSIVPDTINGIIEWFKSLPGRAIQFVADLVSGVIDWFASLPGKIQTALINLSVALVTKFYEMKADLTAALPGIWQSILDYFGQIPEKIAERLGEIGEVGKNLASGLWEGIKSMGSWLKDKIVQWVEDHIPGPIRWALDIHSPSGVTTEIGEQTGAGVAAGINNSLPGVDAAVGNLSDQITSITLPAIPMNDVLKEFAENTESAEARLTILNNGFKTFRTEQTGTQDAVQAVNDTMRETPSALEGFTASMITANGQINTTTAEGSKVYNQIKDVQTAFDMAGSAAYAYAVESGQSSQAATQAAVDASTKIREQFVQQAVDTGLPIEEAQRLADTYGLLPTDILTKLTANSQEAQDAINKFIQDNTNREMQLRITANTKEIDEAVSQYGKFSPEAIAIANRQTQDRIAKRATGGWINGPGNGTSDSILGVDAASGIPMAWVSNGEFVVNARDAQKYADILEQINSGSFTALATGGPVGSSAPATADAGSSALAGALAVVAAEVEAVTTEAKTTWDAFVTAMTASMTAYNASTVSLFSAMGTSVTASHTLMFTNILAATTAFVTTQNASFTGLSSTVLAIVVAMAKEIEARFGSMWLTVTDQSTLSSDKIAVTFQGLATSLATTMTDSIVPVFDSFTPMLEALEESFASTVDNVGTIWEGIQEKTAAPARFVINDVYNDGIRGAWNQFNDFLDLPPLAEQVAKFKEGGKVWGAGNGTSDSIPAMLSNGEHVITAKEVRGAGGHQAIESARAVWGSSNPALYAKGGPVGYATGGSVSGGAYMTTPVQQSMWDAVRTAFPGVVLTSGTRTEQVLGRPDNHNMGRALDLGGPMQAIAQWIARTYPNSLELIHAPEAGFNNIWHGQKHTYDAGTMSDHFDHVHWAVDNIISSDGKLISDAGGGPAVPMDQMVRDAINKKMDEVRDRAPKFGGGIGDWVPKSIEKGRKGLLDKLVPLAAVATQAMSDAGVPGNVESWRPMAMEAMRRNGFNADDPRQVDAMMKQIASESSGIPNNVQKVQDVNSGGNEAVGLLQIAKGTWPGVRDPSLPDDRTDPWANMNGALRYYKGKYGMDLTTHWGHNMGYDEGGILQPGITQAINASGKPEAILTATQWEAMYRAAENTVDAQTIEDGVVGALKSQFGFAVLDSLVTAQADETAKALAVEDTAKWQQNVYDATKEAATAAEMTAASSEKQKTALENFVEIGGKIQGGINDLSKVMLAVATAMQGEQNFSAWAPVISAVGDLISNLPDAKAEYVPWQAFDVEMTDEMKKQKSATDAANAAKGIYTIFKDVGAPILKHTAAIGTAIEKLITQNSSVVSAAIAMMPVNPVGGAIMLIPVILQSIFTILPMVIAAIMDIIPAFIKAIQKFVTQFSPFATFAYDDIAGAEEAVKNNTAAIKDGSYLASQGVKQPGKTIDTPTNQTVNINIYGGLNMPNVKNGDDAGDFVTNLQNLAGND